MKNVRKTVMYIIIGMLFLTGFIFSSIKEKNSNKLTSSDEILVPESIDDIPPSIIDNVAPDVEQKFKSEAKDFEAHDENGNEIRLSDYRGKNIVINLWSTSSESCLEELPYFDQAIEKYQGQVEFLMINLIDGNSETKEIIAKYLEDNNIQFKTIFDDHYDVRVNYKVTSLPRTIFIDKNGLIQKDIKFTVNEEILDKQIQNLITIE